MLFTNQFAFREFFYSLPPAAKRFLTALCHARKPMTSREIAAAAKIRPRGIASVLTNLKARGKKFRVDDRDALDVTVERPRGNTTVISRYALRKPFAHYLRKELPAMPIKI